MYVRQSVERGREESILTFDPNVIFREDRGVKDSVRRVFTCVEMIKASVYSSKARSNQTVEEKRAFFIEFQLIYAEGI